MRIYDDESWGFHMEDVEYIEDVNSKHATNIIMRMIKVSSLLLYIL